MGRELGGYGRGGTKFVGHDCHNQKDIAVFLERSLFVFYNKEDFGRVARNMVLFARRRYTEKYGRNHTVPTVLFTGV